MDFRLKVFHSVACNLSFTKASRELFISQPAISKHIHELEVQYKTPLFERTGRHRGADSRIVAVERDPEVFQPEVGGKPLAFVGDGRRGALEDTPHGHPVAEPVKTVFGGFHFELPAGIFRTDERGRLALWIGEHPARVLELTPRSDTFERVGGRCKIFHLYAFV